MGSYDKREKRQAVYTNERIRCRQVRIADDGRGASLGVMPLATAISIAKSRGVDVVQVGFNAGVAICKLYDYGKFMYEQKQRAKEAKKKARAAAQDLKEICFSIRIDSGDLETKTRHAKKLLEEENCKVKLNVQFSKREMVHLDLGKEVLKSVISKLEGIAEMDVPPKAENRSLHCTLRPKKR